MSKPPTFLRSIKIPQLATSISLPFIAAAIGSYFTMPAITSWYATLEKPFFSPPNWLFGPVWTLLYLLMGISLYLVWTARANKAQKAVAMKVFFVQLVLNSVWSIVFFGLQSPLLALLVIVGLWILIVLTIKHFLKISKIASWLLIPYLAWVSFASLLNLAIFYLN